MLKKNINSEIRSTKVILIGLNGEKLGEVGTEQAIGMAQESGMDLVQLNEEDIPVCRIMAFSKTEYDRKKKIKSNHKSVKLKEVRFGSNIGIHDLDVKVHQINKFLEDKQKVLVSVKRGGRIKHSIIEQKMEEILAKINIPFSKIGNPGGNGQFFSVHICPKI